MTNAPDGLSEADYEAIEAAVMETVRGRWFLTEFARRSRVAEMRQVLDAVGRLERLVTEERALPPADPSVRLLIERLKQVSSQLNGLAAKLRAQGQDAGLCAQIESQAQAVAGLLRLNAAVATPAALPAETQPAPALPSDGERRPGFGPDLRSAPAACEPPLTKEARLAALARLDALPIAEKLALFS